MEQMEIDDSQSVPQPSRNNTVANYAYIAVSRLAAVVALPLTLTLSLLSYTLRLLRIPVPRPSAISLQSLFSSIWAPSTFTRRRYENPGTLAERWVHELEAEVGAGENEGSEKCIPEFYLGSYEDALNVARKELRIMCVVLVSEEHDDVAPFKRE